MLEVVTKHLPALKNIALVLCHLGIKHFRLEEADMRNWGFGLTRIEPQVHQYAWVWTVVPTVRKTGKKQNHAIRMLVRRWEKKTNKGNRTLLLSILRKLQTVRSSATTSAQSDRYSIYNRSDAVIPFRAAGSPLPGNEPEKLFDIFAVFCLYCATFFGFPLKSLQFVVYVQ